MKRTIYYFMLTFCNVNDRKYENVDSYETDFCNIFKDLNSKNKREKRHRVIGQKRVAYLSDYSLDSSKSVIFLRFTSAKYDSVRTVIDTNTLIEKSNLTKSQQDGEEEYNHMAIRFIDNNKAVCVYESNKEGIGMTKAIEYLNTKIKATHVEKKDNKLYKIKHENLVSKDFLDALENIDRITMVKLSVNREQINVSDQKAFAQKNDLHNTVDIILKPAGRGLGILSDTVKDFYKMYNNPGSIVKSVTIEGEGEQKEPIKFDTEAMKKKEYISVKGNSRGEVITSSINSKFKELLMP